MSKGAIRQLVADRGFGFIRTADGRELFFHRSGVEGVEYNSLREEKEVEFEVGRDRIGRPQAVRVRLSQEQKDDR